MRSTVASIARPDRSQNVSVLDRFLGTVQLKRKGSLDVVRRLWMLKFDHTKKAAEYIFLGLFHAESTISFKSLEAAGS